MEFPTVHLGPYGLTDHTGAALVVGRPLINGAIYLDADPELSIHVQLMLVADDMDSTDHNSFRCYVKPAHGLVDSVAVLNAMDTALLECDSIAQMDRYLVTTCGFDRAV